VLTPAARTAARPFGASDGEVGAARESGAGTEMSSDVSSGGEEAVVKGERARGEAG